VRSFPSLPLASSFRRDATLRPIAGRNLRVTNYLTWVKGGSDPRDFSVAISFFYVRRMPRKTQKNRETGQK
jgi:hypothetical protein